MRKIIHIDMDCFYAAIEMRERPELLGKPIAVGGGGERSVIATCNYEARAFGVRSGMPGFMARERCAHLLFLPVRMDLYRQESERLRALFFEYTDLVEPLALDEAFLDVSESNRYAWEIAKEIRARLFALSRLTASAGIAPNKMLAKIASDWRKPNGQFAILPDQIATFMGSLPIQKIWGVGPKSRKRFEALGIKTCADLQQLSRLAMAEHFGKWGGELYDLCRGKDERAVIPHRWSKSFSSEKTFLSNLLSLQECRSAMQQLAQEMLADLHLEAPDRKVKKAFIKIKFADFKRRTKECLSATPTEETFCELLTQAYIQNPHPVRLLGAGVRFAERRTLEQGELFDSLVPL